MPSRTSKTAYGEVTDDHPEGRRDVFSALRNWSIDLPGTLFLLIGGLLLPNALAIVGGLWIGVPTRTTAIAAYAAVALLCALLPRFFAGPLFIAAVFIDILGIVTHIFYLDLSLISQNIPAFNHVKILASPLYTELALATTMNMIANIAFLSCFRAQMARGSRIVFGLMIVIGLMFDIQANGSTNLDIGPTAGIGKPFQSAVKMSGFNALPEADRPRRNVLLVLVESLGYLRDAEQRRVLFSAFDDPALKERFAITTGTTSFYGPTAYGEMRELCGVRAYYTVVLGGHPPSCLPSAFVKRGYRTVSIHGFTSKFYDRLSWYPTIGFARSIFEETTQAHYGRRCGGPFVGLCDVDIAGVLSERFATTKDPMFVYWLTLNSHVPVRAEEATPRHDCATGGPFNDPEVCAMAEIWEDLFDAVNRLALRNPETEILLVGDHAPPLWRRNARRKFMTDRVPWIRLAPLGSPRHLSADAALQDAR
ncbi:sulfatase-like hydrolase/transferase [Methylobacterium sp. P31]